LNWDRKIEKGERRGTKGLRLRAWGKEAGMLESLKVWRRKEWKEKGKRSKGKGEGCKAHGSKDIG
jgi:hypothetical protein